ncbi:hypothetical protein FHL15_002931 [Xylaria flabelliformis]|uniref:Uncharacterized protein n=1 Tax=Xylaria flabelliformis TaxID=2512241 RepID=A0A553I7N3_9PEZI|nr:hypothetical protein FHL15_002931 [Xylaria flabelliformis]
MQRIKNITYFDQRLITYFVDFDPLDWICFGYGKGRDADPRAGASDPGRKLPAFFADMEIEAQAKKTNRMPYKLKVKVSKLYTSAVRFIAACYGYNPLKSGRNELSERLISDAMMRKLDSYRADRSKRSHLQSEPIQASSSRKAWEWRSSR